MFARVSGLVVFVNENSGRGRARWLLDRLREREARLHHAVVVSAPTAATARAELDRALDAGPERVVIFGGDGTVHLVANKVLDRGQGADVTLGLVPAGTGSDFSRALQIPRVIFRAMARALDGAPVRVDALRVVTDDGASGHAINVASAGISGMVDEEVNAIRRRGTISYLAATLRALNRYRNVPCRVTVDGARWHEGPMLLLAVANGRCFGNGMRIAPHASPHDGLADVVLVGPVPRAQLPFRLPQIYLGTHLATRFVRYQQAREVRLEPLAPLPPLDLDGETMASGAVTISVEPGVLRFAGRV
jgi:diacylglycerol kinase (ATP)